MHETFQIAFISMWSFEATIWMLDGIFTPYSLYHGCTMVNTKSNNKRTVFWFCKNKLVTFPIITCIHSTMTFFEITEGFMRILKAAKILPHYSPNEQQYFWFLNT